MPVNKTEVTYNLQIADIVPKFSRLSDDEQEDIKEMVGDLLLEEIESFLDSSKSPVKNGKYKSLKADGEPSQLYLSGDMRSTLEWISVEGGVEVGIFNSTEAIKAYAHNTGDGVPLRQFIPEDDMQFKKGITDKIKALVLNAIEA